MLRIICLSLLVAGASAIVCTPEICEASECEEVTEANCDGLVKANGGFCGCCDACVTELGKFMLMFSMCFFRHMSGKKCQNITVCDIG